MKLNNSYAVFGLGKYGRAVAEELARSGADVIAVDKNESIVEEAALKLPICKCADITDPEVISRLGISNVDVAIVAMAESLEASVLAITLLKEAKVPTVIAKCGSEMHKKILTRIGADRVVIPEMESGIRLGKSLLSSGFTDIVELSKDVSMIEMDIREEWLGKNLIELSLRKKYSINVVALIKENEAVIDIDPSMPLTKDMKLIVIADTNKLKKLK
ncbi:MAG: TrkA family potassium uptake protein [Ruminococcaceae bacterium]|nr:TrkA family potassium uptake protein [Oscillospiraceae bacterium]